MSPVALHDDIWGIGFKTADQIASKLGMAHDCYERLRDGLMYTLNKLAESGHCYAVREQLLKTGAKLLEAEEPPLDAALTRMIEAGDVISEEEALYLPPFYFSEAGCARKIHALINAPKGAPVEDGALEVLFRWSEIHYDKVQMDAIRMAVSSKMMVLTGGPGTGKTTTTLGIISAYQSAGCTVLLAAPTGRAAKRLSEATGLEAKTIHRLLGFKPPEGYQRNEEQPLEGMSLCWMSAPR